MSDRFKTIQDMYDYHYAPREKGDVWKPLNSRVLGALDQISKADDPLLTSTAGWTNTAYGRAATNWLNHESNIHGLLPKEPWPAGRRGWRNITGDATRFSGRLEGGSLQDTDKPTFTPMYAPIVVMQSTWEWSLHADLTADHDDSLAIEEELREYYTSFHPENIDFYLGRKGATVTGATAIIESIDRMISNETEATNAISSGGLTGATAFDIYPAAGRFRRSGGQTTFDAYVDANSGTDRVLTEQMLKDLITNAIDYGANIANGIILTGTDTKDDIDDILSAKQRYLDTTKVVATLNGVKRSALIGTETGFEVNTYRGVPIFTSQHVAKTGTKSNVYYIDLDHLKIWVALPTTYVEADNWILLDTVKTKAAYVTSENLMCDKLPSQGKIIDIG